MLDTTGQSGLDISNVTLTGSFTVETWIWFRPGEQITNKDGLLRTENGGAHINFYNGQLRFASYMTGEPRGDVVVGATQLGTGSWHHVAVTRDENDILRAYVDGVLDGTATEAWTADLVVDQITQTKRGTTDGAFDEFRIWDRELDAAELTAAKDVTIDPASPDLVRYWRFDDPNQIIDETGNQTPLAPPTGASLLPSTSPV
ncbi:MAG: LamG domain-containing protein, partial [Pseudomonadota bacterium]